LDKNESCPTADLSNTGRSNGPAYSTGELLNMLLLRSGGVGGKVCGRLHSSVAVRLWVLYRFNEFIDFAF